MSEMSDPVSEGVNTHLAEENAKLEQMVGLLQGTIESQNNLLASRSSAEQQILAYLPQLTHIATNLSMVASAIQSNNQNLVAIVKALEQAKPGRPRQLQPGNTGRACRCDGSMHEYTQGWCPKGGPVYP